MAVRQKVGRKGDYAFCFLWGDLQYIGLIHIFHHISYISIIYIDHHRSAYLHVSPGEKVGAFVAPKHFVSKPADHMYWCVPREERVLTAGIPISKTNRKHTKLTPLFSCSSSSHCWLVKPSEITNTRLKKHMDDTHFLPFQQPL